MGKNNNNKSRRNIAQPPAPEPESAPEPPKPAPKQNKRKPARPNTVNSKTQDPREIKMGELSQELFDLCTKKSRSGERVIKKSEVNKDNFTHIIAFLMEQINAKAGIDPGLKKDVVIKTMNMLIDFACNDEEARELHNMHEIVTPELMRMAIEASEGRVNVQNFNKTKWCCFWFA
jgi:hypothetical protein